MSNGWIGVDFDGTLSIDMGRDKPPGPPVRPVLDLVKELLAHGHDVRIFTARCFDGTTPIHQELAKVREWCLVWIGQQLPITNVKDHHMNILLDDRAISVNKNAGNLAGFRSTDWWNVGAL